MIVVPSSFRDQPRWAYDVAGRAWLDALPELVAAQCGRWALEVDGTPAHGSNALVVPVRREDEALALRLAPPGDDVARHARDLRLWDGHGTVVLHEDDPAHRALLLERLDAGTSLAGVPLEQAVETLAALTVRLAVPVPAEVPTTREDALQVAEGFREGWEETGRPIPPRQADQVIAHARALADRPAGDRAVDGDLHFEQVLAGAREPWLVVDPVLLRGDPEYHLGRVLWTRADEIADDARMLRLFDLFVRAAGVPRERARSWVVTRAGSYLTWGLQHGLTYDPPKCIRLLDLFA